MKRGPCDIATDRGSERQIVTPLALQLGRCSLGIPFDSWICLGRCGSSLQGRKPFLHAGGSRGGGSLSCPHEWTEKQSPLQKWSPGKWSFFRPLDAQLKFQFPFGWKTGKNGTCAQDPQPPTGHWVCMVVVGKHFACLLLVV